jgi:hypothetical protein
VPPLGDPCELDRIADSAANFPPGAGDDGDRVSELARALGLHT